MESAEPGGKMERFINKTTEIHHYNKIGSKENKINALLLWDEILSILDTIN